MGLLVEVELERLGEFLFRVSRRGVFFAETDEVLSYVAAFDAARDALREKLESEGDEGCVLAAEDSRALEVGEGLREEVLVEVVFWHLEVNRPLDGTYAGLNVGDD